MKKILGIELGSTRIKSILIDETGKPLASGVYEWANKLVGGYWSYDLDEIVKGIQASYSELVKDLGQTITSLDGLGISAMMHGYLAFDKNDKPLVPFRTWRNTTTSHAAKELTELFGFNAYGTTHADYFYGDIPCTRSLAENEMGEYEKNTGVVINETFKDRNVVAIPSCLVKNHGVFAWGRDADEAVYHATVTEEVAKMAYITEMLGCSDRLPQFIADKHYNRKHGKNAYYGQRKQ